MAAEVTVIVLDPGHGGPDAGACANELREADLVYDLAEQAAMIVDGLPAVVAVTRDRAEDPSHDERAEVADVHGADLAILIHADANNDPTVHGATVYTIEEEPEHGIAVAVGLAFLDGLPASLRTTRRFTCKRDPPPGREWTKRARACLLPYHKRGIPAVLIEVGYLTSITDAALLGRWDGVALVATAIRRALIEGTKLLEVHSRDN